MSKSMDDLIKIEVLIEEEETSVEGSFDTGDPAADRVQEAEILQALQNGNQWAWCTVQVVATHRSFPEFSGTDFLGCCNYESEEDFRNSDYFQDMKKEAIAQLTNRLEDATQALKQLYEAKVQQTTWEPGQYEVDVCRTGYRHKRFRVDLKPGENLHQVVNDLACNSSFDSETSSEYDIVQATPVENNQR